MRNLILSVSFALTLTIGCSSASKKTDKKPVASETKAENSIVYVSAAKAGLPAADCPKSAEGWKSLGWQRLLRAGRACYAYNEIFRMQEIGFHLSEKYSNLPWGPYFLSLDQEHKGSLSSALWYVELAKKKAPSEPLVEYQRARIHYLSGETVKSTQALEQLVKKHPYMLEATFFIGQVYAASGRFEESISYLRRYLQDYPQDKAALTGVARSYDELGKFDLALPVYQKLVFIDQTNWQARLRIAQLNEKMNDNKSIALASYENLQNYVRTSRSKIVLPIDLDTKIKDLKAELGQKVSLREPTSEKVKGK